jgi:hypothetical protein
MDFRYAAKLSVAVAAVLTLAACSGAGSTTGPSIEATAPAGAAGSSNSSGSATAPAATPKAASSATPGPTITGSAATSPQPSTQPTAAGAAVAGGFAPLNKPGPPLDVPAASLAASLTCTSNVGKSSEHTILLVPGTTLTPSVNFDWNYERAFTANGMPWCAVTLPENAMGDIPTAGEYVVNALRTVAARSGHKVDVLGYSQGGMVPRWALRFWPDTRALVDQYVALDPSNHGTVDAYPVCAAGCAPAFWQQQSGSHFTTALNSGAETFSGISYTVVYSDDDEVVVPNLPVASSSSLETGGGTIANISVQSICPTDVSEHLAMGSYDPVGYALAIDSFTRNAVAKPSDVPLSVCATLFQPGVDPATFASNYAMYTGYVATTIATTPFVSAEPTLPPYVYAAP